MKASDICNWCGHPKRRHHVAEATSLAGYAVGCLVYDKSADEFCQCSAERGRVRMPPTKKRSEK